MQPIKFLIFPTHVYLLTKNSTLVILLPLWSKSRVKLVNVTHVSLLESSREFDQYSKYLNT